jgi:hypothetical protein
MGGPGSGSLPDNDQSRPGRKRKAALAVVGTGVPEKPDKLPVDVSDAWDMLASLTAGVTFSQDSLLIESTARLWVRVQTLAKLLDSNPADIELNRVSLAVERQLMTSLGKLGLTPRDRQVLLVPQDEKRDLDPFEQLLAKRVRDANAQTKT